MKLDIHNPEHNAAIQDVLTELIQMAPAEENVGSLEHAQEIVQEYYSTPRQLFDDRLKDVRAERVILNYNSLGVITDVELHGHTLELDPERVWQLIRVPRNLEVRVTMVGNES